ncbi:MAG: CRISPR-associated endonuclease Cas3'' [Gammaproteobacteria bacterium]|nr:CRISPR-associated endonuclease Cas3'' [Gammaproteobacteria bacterium]
MFAHSHPQHPTETNQWEPLYSKNDGHLNKVAELCTIFSSDTFNYMGNGNGCWEKLGRLAGNWHDLGKFSNAFQAYLKRSAEKDDDAHTSEVRGRVDHTSAGAQHAVESLPPGIGALLAYPIAGHHAGLLDGLGTGACLKARLEKETPD